MRSRLGLTLAIVVILGLVGLSEAACRAAGEYRVTGPTIGGFLTLKETRSDASSSWGTVDMALVPKGGCDLCDPGGRTLIGEYFTGPGWDGSCVLGLTAFDAVSKKTGGVSGTLAFGGAVIFFEGYSIGLGPKSFLDMDLNLTHPVGFPAQAIDPKPFEAAARFLRQDELLRQSRRTPPGMRRRIAGEKGVPSWRRREKGHG